MLFVGRISKEKNLDTLVASTRKLADWKLAVRPLFVGDGPYLSEMKRLLPDALFTGYLRGEELADAYASADFFVFPSTTDTFGNVVLEAQASGLPVIVSDVGGPRDLVSAWQGWLYYEGARCGRAGRGHSAADGRSEVARAHGIACSRARRDARLVGGLRNVLARFAVASPTVSRCRRHQAGLMF